MKLLAVRCAVMFILSSTLISAANAQLLVSARAGIVQYTQGSVFLDGNPLLLLPGGYVQMKERQSLQTKHGYVELLLAPNVYLRLGENSSLRLDCSRVDDVQLDMQHGSALMESVEATRGSRTRVRISTSIVEIKKAGLYRLDADSGELRVYGGAALAMNGSKRRRVKSDGMVRLDGKLTATKFDANASDALHKWAGTRSFILFLSSPAARSKNINWTPIDLGWMQNYNYRMRFFSKRYYDEWAASHPNRQASESAEAVANAASAADLQQQEATTREQDRIYNEAMQSVQSSIAAGAAAAQQANPQPAK